MKYYLQIILLLGISFGYLVNAEIQCSPDWLSEDYTADPCYSCMNQVDLVSWCTKYMNGENPPDLQCCETQLLGSDYMDIMPIEEDYEYFDIDSDEYEYYDSDSDSEDEFFPGSDLSDDQFAGRITNDEILLPLPSSLEEFDSITITPPNLVDFIAPPDCSLASVLGNNYVESYQIAKQKCTKELKEQLSLEFSSLQEQVSETKANFQNFLQEYSSRLSEDEIEEVKTQIADLDTQMVERSERMRAKLQNPDCSPYTDIVKEEAIMLAVNTYERVLEVDEILAGDQLFCLENYIRRIQSSLEECQYQILNLYGALIPEENTDFIYEKMCRSSDVQRVQDIVNEFFDEISYESAYPTPVVEPIEYLEPDDLSDQMELRRLEIKSELEELQQELDQANTDKESIFNNYVEVSDQRVSIVERINELEASGYSDSDELSELSDELDVILPNLANLESELSIINQLIRELESEMSNLLAEERELEMQLGVLPDEQPTSAIDHFISILGPGPVQIEMPTEDSNTEDVPTEDSNVEDVPTEDSNVEDVPTEPDVVEVDNPQDIITDEISQMYITHDLFFEPEAGEHRRPLKYLIGILVGVVLLIVILMTSLCILICVLKKRRTVKKVPYSTASLSDKDPALILKQTGFENPIYKFYVENSKREH